MTDTTNISEPNYVILDATVDKIDAANSSARAAIALANSVPRVPNVETQLLPAHEAVVKAAEAATKAAREYTQAADAIKTEAFRQSGGSVVPSGFVLHQRERDAREADKIPNTFFPWLG